MLSPATRSWLEANDYDPNDLNRVGKYGNSALMKAVREANTDVAKELLERGVDLEIQNIDGNTALWNACFGECDLCVALLVQAGINLDNQNDNGVTALMYCASSGKEEMTKLLLQHGADKNLENLDGFKAIDLACTPKIYNMLK
jgi:ankyrin repeat protein